MITPFEKFMLFVATYLSAMGRDLADPRHNLQKARAQAQLFDKELDYDPESMAWDFVQWSIGRNMRPEWVLTQDSGRHPMGFRTT